MGAASTISGCGAIPYQERLITLLGLSENLQAEIERNLGFMPAFLSAGGRCGSLCSHRPSEVGDSCRGRCGRGDGDGDLIAACVWHFAGDDLTAPAYMAAEDPADAASRGNGHRGLLFHESLCGDQPGPQPGGASVQPGKHDEYVSCGRMDRLASKRLQPAGRGSLTRRAGGGMDRVCGVGGGISKFQDSFRRPQIAAATIPGRFFSIPAISWADRSFCILRGFRAGTSSSPPPPAAWPAEKIH